MTTRWPLHPGPEPGECLSSWIDRLAHCYGLRRHEIISAALPPDAKLPTDIDIAPPESLLDGLQARTGVDKHTLRKMTAEGLPLWKVPAGGGPIIRSILLPPTVPTGEAYIPVLPWVSSRPMRRYCPECVADRCQKIPLLWGIPVVLTCEVHDCYLELWEHRHALARQNAPAHGRSASDAAKGLDKRTRSAANGDIVKLRHSALSPATWFELLHCLLLELSTPALLTQIPAESRSRLALRASDRLTPVTKWQQFELVSKSQQIRLLEAAARCLFAIENGTLRPPGASDMLQRLVPASPAQRRPTIFLTRYDECLESKAHAHRLGNEDRADCMDCLPTRVLEHFLVDSTGEPWARPRQTLSRVDWGTIISVPDADAADFNDSVDKLETVVARRRALPE